MKAAAEALLGQRSAERRIGREGDHRHAGDFAEERHRAAGTRIHLEHIRNSILDHKLNIDQPHRLNQSGDEPGRLDHPLRFFGGQGDRWIDRKRVTGMDPGPLDML